MCWYVVWISRKGCQGISREQSWECWGCSLTQERGRTRLSQCLLGSSEGIPHFGAFASVSGTMVGTSGIFVFTAALAGRHPLSLLQIWGD